MHQAEHARIARECQVTHTVVPANGDIVRVREGHAPEIVGEAEVGILAVDGSRLIPVDSSVIKGRRRQIEQGGAVVTIVMDFKGRLMAPPQVSATGLLSADQDQAALKKVTGDVEIELEGLSGAVLRNDAEVKEATRLAARRSLLRLTGKKPAVDVHLVRVN
jgi:ribonuclease J